MEVPLDGSGGEGPFLVFLYPQGLLPLPLAAPCNAANDHRAITIEVASDTTEPYAVNDTAYAATIDKETSDAVLTGYEKPTDQSDSIKTKRAGYGQTYYDKYAESTSGGTSAEISADSLPALFRLRWRLSSPTSTTVTSRP